MKAFTLALALFFLCSTARAATFALGRSSVVEGPATGNDSVVLSVSPATGQWLAQANASWLQLAPQSTNGAGSANVLFTFDANPGATRTGTLTIGGQTFTIIQAGAAYLPAAATTGLAENLNTPFGVAVDSAGNVYVADSANNAIQKYSAATQSVAILVSTGLNNPYGVAVDHAGNVYIADQGDNSIKEYIPSTQVLTTLVSTGLSSPYGVAVDGAGNVYIADTGNDAIEEYTPSTQTFTTLVSSGLAIPTGVAVDSSGNIYIADSNNNAIEEYTPSTQTLTTLVSMGLNGPLGVAVDGAGNVYIADAGNNAIEEYTPSTQALTALVSSGVSSPSGVAVDSAGNLFIGDTGNNAIEEYAASTQAPTTLVSPLLSQPAGLAVDSAGNAYLADSANSVIYKYTAATQSLSTLISSGLSNPSGVAVDSAGNLYIADTGNNAIEEYKPASKAFITLVSGLLSGPMGVALDGAGNVYIADTGNDAIEEYKPASKAFITLVSTGLSSPAGVAVDAAGNIYIADSGNAAVEEYTPSTQVFNTLVGGLYNPVGVAVDGSGNVYIADPGDSQVDIYTPSTQTIASFYSIGANGVAVDGSENIYIANATGLALDEIPRAFVNVASVSELAASSSDSVIAALPAAVNLAPPFAPTSDQPWLSIGAAGGGLLHFSFSTNFDTPRTAHIMVLGDQITVSQGSAPTIYARGTMVTINAAIGANATYSVSPALPAGLTLNPATGVISGTPTALSPPAAYTVMATSASGTTEETIAIGIVPPYVLGTTAVAEGPAAGGDAVTLTVADGATGWTATANATWLHITKGSASGAGSANVLFSFDANADATRTGTLSIAGQTVTVTQAGSTYLAVTASTPLVSLPKSTIAGVAVDGAGNVYIADSLNNLIDEYSPATQALTTLVSTGLNGPVGVAVDGSGNVYIADSGNVAIEEYSPATQAFTTLISSGLGAPAGVAVDPFGNLYIADTANMAIEEFQAATQSLFPLASSGLTTPAGVAVDASGNVYIADPGNDAIEEYSAATQGVTTPVSAALGLQSPTGVAVDGSGNLYISDSATNEIDKYSASTQTFISLVGGSNEPAGVAVDAIGNVYIADTGNDEIEELPRAFFDPTPRSESELAGSDALPPVFPATVNLLPPFAPTSDQAWLTIGAISGGVIPFSFPANTGATRTAHIALFGQSITITQVGAQTPIAVNDVVFTTGAAPIVINVLANDSSPLGYPLTVASVTQPAHGRVVINANSTLTYTPKTSFAATAVADSFNYTISDGHGNSAAATVTIRNPFQTIKGSYDGLVTDSGGPLNGMPNGYLSLTLTGLGRFTGSLKLAGFSYPFSGAFDLTGKASVSIKIAGKIVITIVLDLNEATGSDLSASISAGANSYAADLGPRESYGPGNPAASAGPYTALLPAPAAPTGTTATAVATVSAGKITGYSLTGGGSGYVAPPRVVISGPPGAGAKATAIVSGGLVTGFVINAAGARYPGLTAAMTIDPPSDGLPPGNGWATLRVTTSGAVTAVGKLGDGTAFSSGSFVHHGAMDSFAFYASLYSGISKPNAPGSIVGTIPFASTGSCDGPLAWVKPEQTAGAFYAGGFTTSVQFMGASYLAPHQAQALDFTDKTAGAAGLVLSFGNLVTPIQHQLSISKLNIVTVTNPAPDKLSLKLNAAAGTITGSFLNPTTHAASTISGVLNQKTNTAEGLFLGSSQSGSMILTPQ